MELSQSFTGAVVLLCAIHLAGVIGRAVFSRPAQDVRDRALRQPQQRSDWYLFFRCSDLTGSATRNTIPAADQQQRAQDSHAVRRDPPRSRPRLSC